MRDLRPILVGYHFAKTGGTSLLRHAKKHLPSDQFHEYGSGSNARRREAGEQLLTELASDQLDRLLYVNGHGIDIDIARLFQRRKLCLFTVVRDPYDRFISSYKHRLRTKPKDQQPTPRELLDEQGENPFSSHVSGRFGSGRLQAALGRFDCLVATEHLDVQSKQLFAFIGLPGAKERARVYPETPDLDGIRPEDIYARDPIDREIHQNAVAYWLKHKRLGNPYRPAWRKIARRTFRAI